MAKDSTGKKERQDVTILLVEDELMMLALLALTLRRAGYVVVTASNATEAFEIAGNPAQKLDLLITDYVLPGRNGETLFKTLQKKRPALPAICITGMMEAGERFLNLGQAFLQKPFPLDELIRAVEKRLQNGKQTSERRSTDRISAFRNAKPQVLIRVNDQAIPGTLLNFSTRGALVAIPEAVAEDVSWPSADLIFENGGRTLPLNATKVRSEGQLIAFAFDDANRIQAERIKSELLRQDAFAVRRAGA